MGRTKPSVTIRQKILLKYKLNGERKKKKQTLRRRTTCSGRSPFQKLHILRVLDEARPHHDGLETLAVDGPQLHVGQSCKEEE